MLQYSPVAQELAVHGLDGRVRRLERVVADEAKAAREARLRVPHDLWRLNDDAKGVEGVVQQLQERQTERQPVSI